MVCNTEGATDFRTTCCYSLKICKPLTVLSFVEVLEIRKILFTYTLKLLILFLFRHKTKIEFPLWNSGYVHHSILGL